jgi:uncharacterized membrane protein
MPRITIGGHPLHPIAVIVPSALLPFSSVLDALYMATGDESFAQAAFYSLVGGYAGAVVAAGAGAGDYATIRSGTTTKQLANTHVALNVAATTLFTLSLLRRSRGRAPGRGPVVLSALGTAILLASAWYGGELVYEQGMRVRQAQPREGTPELKPPGDELVASALRKAAALAPAIGPEDREVREQYAAITER